MAGAQTGTGKTAAFALPILQRLAPQASNSASPARHPLRALVLTPTRELAIQVAQSFAEYGKNLPLRSTVVYGGVDMNAQIAQLRKGVEVLVATPGRLLDHAQNKTVMFNQVSTLVLDEADRMRSEEHTSELQSQSNLVCRLLLEKRNTARFQC